MFSQLHRSLVSAEGEEGFRGHVHVTSAKFSGFLTPSLPLVSTKSTQPPLLSSEIGQPPPSPLAQASYVPRP